MDDRNSVLRKKAAKLLREAAEAKVALDRAEGKINGVPHYSVIENTAHEVGRELSRLVQQMHLTELIANQPLSGRCPKCHAQHGLKLKKRTVTSGDGPVEVTELVGDCTCCRQAFFPSARNSGI